MKQKLILSLAFCSLLCTGNLKAQKVDDQLQFDTHQEEMDYMLSNLVRDDSEQFKNGILYDRVYPFSNLNEFNKVGPDTSNYDYFLQVWKELEGAKLESASKLSELSIDMVKNLSLTAEKENSIFLGIINVDYTVIDTNYLDSISINSGIGELKIDEKGKYERLNKRNPYIDKHKIIVAPLASHIIHSNEIDIQLSPIVINKSDKNISKLSVTFNKNTKTLISNKTVASSHANFNFKNSGSKIFKFDIVYSDGTSSTTFSSVDVKLLTPAKVLEIEKIKTITATENFIGYGYDNDIEGTNQIGYGQGQYYVQLSSNHTKLTKPVIIMDGFDPKDARGILEENKKDAGSIVDKMKYKDNASNNQNLIDKLNVEGYDVILLNFPEYIVYSGEISIEVWPFINPITYSYNVYNDGGADFIERNANVLKTLIRKTNQDLASNSSSEKLVVIGPSMGGLISRVALKQMEDNSEDHNTRLYISFDSPHNGANISMGVQKLMQRKGAPSLQELLTPAAKQMILNHYVEHDNWESPQPHPYRKNHFAPYLETLGFPENTRNIAWINGRTDGGSLDTEGNSLVWLEKNSWFLKAWVIIRKEKNSGHTKILNYKAPNHSSSQRYSYTHTFEGSLDTSPGSAIRLRKSIKDAWNAAGHWDVKFFGWKPGMSFQVLQYNTNLTNPENETCFIPTKSALAYKGPNKLWREDLSCQNLVCMGWTPFDNYYSPKENQFHLDITQDGVEWVFKELAENEEYVYNEGCPDFQTEIVGETKICKNQIETYTVNNNCGISFWETSSGIELLSSDWQSATIKKTNTSSYNKWIKAHLWTGEVITKKLITRPSFTFSVNSYSLSSLEYQMVLSPGDLSFAEQEVTTIEWQQTGGNGVLTPALDNLSATANHSSWPFVVTGTVKVSNSCGSFTRSFFASDPTTPTPDYDNVVTSGGWGSLFILNSAQSANSYVVIDPDQVGSSEISSSKLYDLFGNQVQEFIHNQDEVNIDNTTGLVQTRILKVTMNGKTKNKIITVQ